MDREDYKEMFKVLGGMLAAAIIGGIFIYLLILGFYGYIPEWF